MASTAILMSAAFLREPPRRCGISISSTRARASSRRSSSKYDQSAYARRTLKFESDIQYEFLSGRVQPWNWGRGANGGWLYVGDNLRDAVTKHPALKVLVCSGYYDLATPFFSTDYQVSHLGLAPGLRKNIRQTYYEGGHMMYHHLPSLEKLKQFRREAGREKDPFEIIMVAENPLRLDDVRRAEDLGITQMILLPAYYALHKHSTLDEKRRYWEDFSETVIQPSRS